MPRCSACRFAVAAACVCGVAYLAISCGDDDALPPVNTHDYSGAWLQRITGSVDDLPGPVSVARLSHGDGGVNMWGALLDVTAEGIAGTVPAGANSMEFDLFSADDVNLLGKLSYFDGGGTFMGDVQMRMIRLPDLPSSTLTAAGPACGATIDAGTACAYASKAQIDQDGTPDRWEISVSGVDDTTGTPFVLTFTSNAPLTAKTCTVAAAPSEMSVKASLGHAPISVDEDATSGTVTLAVVDDLGVAGSFSLEMVGGTLTGTFGADVVYRYHASYY